MRWALDSGVPSGARAHRLDRQARRRGAPASCLEFELKVRPKAPKPSKEFKLEPLKAVLSCVRPT